jgi:hypothetical protein
MSAQPIGCDLCNAELAVMLVTNLGNGDTMGVGAACIHSWSQAQADATKPPKPAKAADPPTAPDAGVDGESAAEQPRRPRRARPQPEPIPDGANNLAASREADATAEY